MTDGVRILAIPRHNPVNAFTMGGIVRDAGITTEEFKNSGYPASLERWKIYQVLPDADAEEYGQVRVVDESGEDYLFPSKCSSQSLVFEPSGRLDVEPMRRSGHRR